MDFIRWLIHCSIHYTALWSIESSQLEYRSRSLALEIRFNLCRGDPPTIRVTSLSDCLRQFAHRPVKGQRGLCVRLLWFPFDGWLSHY
jgi:hypothetical protein